MRPLRFLIFSPYFSPHVGGVESFVGEMSEVLVRDAQVDQVTVLAPQLPAAGAPREVLGPRLRVVRYPAMEVIPNFPLPKFWTVGFWRALRAAAPQHHDILVSHTRFFVSSALALLTARLTRRQVVHVEHGSDFVQLGSHLSKWAARAYDHSIGQVVLRRADAVVAVSAAAAAFVRRLAGREATVIYRGFWPHRLEELSPNQDVLTHADGRGVVTYIGRLIDGKGVADLMRAFARMEGDAYVLCLVGDGPRRSDLERLADQLGIRDRVLFLGYVEERQALESILASDVVVNPSYTEGLPTTVLEAALLGRAILATDVGGTGEIVVDGHSGVLVAARDIVGLSSALTRLLDDPELRRRLGETARREAGQRFDWTHSVQRFLEVVRDQVDNRYQST